MTQPVPPGPTPKSRNALQACSIEDLVGGNGTERSPSASSALGLQHYDGSKKKLFAFRTKGDGGPRNRAAPQHRYERQNFAECGELLRNASILLMTRNQQVSTAWRGAAVWGDGR